MTKEQFIKVIKKRFPHVGKKQVEAAATHLYLGWLESEIEKIAPSLLINGQFKNVLINSMKQRLSFDHPLHTEKQRNKIKRPKMYDLGIEDCINIVNEVFLNFR